MAHQGIRVTVVRKHEADNVLAALRVAAAFMGPVPVTVAVTCSSGALNVPNVAVPNASLLESQDQLKALAGILRRVQGVTADNVTINAKALGIVITWAQEGDLRGRVELTPHSNPLPPEDVERVLDLIAEHFEVIPVHMIASRTLEHADAAAIAAQELSVQRLSSAVAALGQLLAKHTEEFTSRTEARAAAADAQIARRAAEEESRIVADRQRLQAEIDEQRGRLEAAESALEQRISAIDDRSRTHKRRALMEALVSRLNEQATTSVGGPFSRHALGVHVVSVMILGLSGWVIGLSLVSMIDGGSGARSLETEAGGFPSADWLTITRLASLTVIFVSTLIYYLRWLAARVDEVTTLRRNQLKIVSDAERAEWIAELVFEWKEDRGSVLPAELLHSFTTGLFHEVRGESREHHPAAEAAQVAGTAGRFRARARSGDREVEYDGLGKGGDGPG